MVGKVIKTFIDKDSLMHYIGESVDLSVERMKKLAEKGLVELKEEIPEEEKPKARKRKKAE